MEWHKLKLESSNPYTSRGTKVFIDDEELHGVTSVKYEIGVDTIPNAEIQLNVQSSFAADCLTRFGFTPATIKQAMVIVRDGFLRDKDLYDALAASIESAVREQLSMSEDWLYKRVSERIADRIIGNDNN